MEIRHLEQFLAVFEAGSFAKGARRLRMSQGALSLGIQALERGLGMTLFDRSHRGVLPNAYAQALYPRARAIINAKDRAQSDLRELLDGGRGKIKVGATPLFALSIIPSALARFHEKYPAVDVAILEGYLAKIGPPVATGEIDCAFGTIGPRMTVRGVESEILLPRLRAIVVAAKNHPFASRDRVKPEEAWRVPWTLPAHPDVYRDKIAEAFSRFDLPLPRTVAEYTSASMEKSLIRMGTHIGPMAMPTAAEDLKKGILAVVPVPELTWTYDCGVIYRPEPPLMPSLVNFISIVREVCKEFLASLRNSRSRK